VSTDSQAAGGDGDQAWMKSPGDIVENEKRDEDRALNKRHIPLSSQASLAAQMVKNHPVMQET